MGVNKALAKDDVRNRSRLVVYIEIGEHTTISLAPHYYVHYCGESEQVL